jgi:hypothetical protein
MIPGGRNQGRLSHRQVDLGATATAAAQLIDVKIMQDGPEPSANPLNILKFRGLPQGPFDAILD